MSCGKIIRIVLVFMVAFLSAAMCGSMSAQDAASRRADRKLLDALTALERGDRSAAERILKALASDPANDAALYYLGVMNLSDGDLSSAQENLRKAVQADPHNYWYRDRLALAYSMAGDDDMTIATYEELLKDFPDKNEIYFNLVNLYLKQNKMDKALEAMDQIETIFGKSESVTSTRYDILLRQNKPEEALKVLTDFNDEYSSPSILSRLGDHSMAEYKDSLAMEYYKEAIDLQSDYAPALLGLAEVYRTRREYPGFFSTLGKFVSNEDIMPQFKSDYLTRLLSYASQESGGMFMQRFRPQLDSVIIATENTHPVDTSVLMMAGSYFYSTGRQSQAMDIFRKNKECNPDNLSANIVYLESLAYSSDWEGVRAGCDSAMKIFPKEYVFFEYKNFACYNLKDYEALIAGCEDVIEKFPGDTAKTLYALASIGDVQHELGNEKETFKYYKKVLKIDPDYAPVLNNYAYYLAIKGKSLNKALKMSKKTIEQEPDNATYLDTIGWILHLMGKDTDAKAYFKHAMLYGGKESPTSLRHYARVLEVLGETETAKVYKSQAEAKEKEGKE